ncbi:MAG: hypothetical protein NT159_09000 [Proteobacteria bacterium]|nr:hypothetical protein [Pseudomonadota bacterium]
MSDNAHTVTNTGTTHIEDDTHTIGATDAEHTSTGSGGTGTALLSTTSPITTGTPSVDQPDAVSDGHDGYEYHKTTGTDHELHGNDLHDSVLTGAQGDDKLVGGTRNDVLDGGDGNNTLDGGSGNDILIAGGETNHGQNHLNGGSGDDILVAGGTKTHSLDDFLKANPVLSTTLASDPKYASLSTLVQGATDDTGGGAVNTFELQSGNGHDLIFNFHASSDKLQIHSGLNGTDIHDSASLASHIHVTGNDVTIDLGSGNSVTLVGVDVAHLSAANLTWV